MVLERFHSVILAGGDGERLWPYSRKDKPKQFLSFRGATSLFEQTLERCLKLSSYVWVVTTKQHEEKIRALSPSQVNVIVEPCKRDTAPAIALATIKILEQNPEAVLGIFPSDHYMGTDGFVEAAREVYRYVQREPIICLLGKKPTRSVTTYGYIEAQKLGLGSSISRVVKFHEKPSQDTAEKYVRDGDKYWNLGMFFAQGAVLYDEITLHIPETLNNVKNYLDANSVSYYQEILAQSFDYAVMEKSINTAVHIVDFMWDDIGSLDEFIRLQRSFFTPKNVTEYNAHNNYVDVTNKHVVINGANDLCVIDCGDVFYITKVNNAVPRQLISYLKEKKQELT